MIDEYYIISINDDRAEYKRNIRQNVSQTELLKQLTVDGNDTDLVAKLIKKYKIPYIWNEAKVGELGIWLTVLNICDYCFKSNKTVLTFEDDAIVESNTFSNKIESLLKECPEDMDAFSVLAPINQMLHAYMKWIDKEAGHGIKQPDIAAEYDVGKPRICRAYQGFSFVSVIYTPRGGKRILEAVRKYGIDAPVDIWFFEMHHQGILNIYTPKPPEADMVTIDGATETTIHNTRRYYES